MLLKRNGNVFGESLAVFWLHVEDFWVIKIRLWRNPLVESPDHVLLITRHLDSIHKRRFEMISREPLSERNSIQGARYE